ncbi:MAG TPA: EAL domain-containing protein [Acetobacteraceae bacterium]|nr:EAL domain-containing protein [Acetobacteraceae bacterium]
MLRVFGCIAEEHDLRLVVLAACICLIASFTTVNLLARAWTAPRGSAWRWLVAAAIVFGCGVWSLHFIAMLAFMPSLPIAYDVKTTVLSVAIAIAGAFLAFSLWRLTPSKLLRIGVGGLLLGLTVSAMHYCGVAAMRLPGTLAFDYGEVTLSIAVSIVFATMAFARGGDLSSLRHRLESSGYLTLCICGMHFTGMAAITIRLGAPTNDAGAVFGSGAMAVAVGSVSFAILLVCLAATLMEQRLSQRAVQELRRLQLLSDASDEVLIIQRGGVILQVNAAGGRMFGVPTTELIGREMPHLIAESDRAAALAYASGKHPDFGPIELSACTKAGTSIPVEMACNTIDYEGKPAMVVTLRDLSRRKHDAERIRYLALHDALTDLPNRFLLKERIAHALAVADRSQSAVALLYLDLDRFKPINDLLGHGGGDGLLVQVAKRMQSELRSTDTLARVGGDEFVVVTSNLQNAENVATLAGRLLETVAKTFEIDGNQVEIGVSIGIAIFPADGDDQESLMRAADTALYRAKQEKRGTFRFFEPAMDEHLQARRQLEQDLRHAVERGELRLHFQPIVNCTSRTVDGYEALVRWQHPQRGLLAPAEFVPLAEETGSIVSIGAWVIEQACLAAAEWKEPYRVALNVSPIQFRQSDLPAIVSAALARSGLPARRLEIEITEGILIEDTERAIVVLSALRELGVHIALDDFGTGYSSLSYLRLFRFDKLKIDKSFIKGLGEDDDAITIVRTIVSLAHNLGLSITAEGVETPQQLARVRSLMCDHVQGYLLGYPVQSDELADLSTGRVQVLMPTVHAAAAE